MRVNEETCLYEHSNKSTEIDTHNTNDEMRNHILIYDPHTMQTSMTYELNEMELYIEHR